MSTEGPKMLPVESIDANSLMGLMRDMEDLNRTLILKHGRARFDESKKALNCLEGAEGGKILVPLCESLYVPGFQGSTDRVLIDVGTNYFVEKTTPESVEYCAKKADLLSAKIGSLEKEVLQKRSLADQVKQVLLQKLQEQQTAATPTTTT
eukprot:Lankesteria_metandrocarpae@DN2275_c0_g1_i2.p1